jgi:DNA-binding protein HU-beta
MTKAEIVQNIVIKTGIDSPTVSAIVEALMETMKESMISGNNIHLRGFGSFLIKKEQKRKEEIYPREPN